MATLVVYELMYGNTRAIADAIAAGLSGDDEVRVVRVRDAGPDLVAWADLLVVGGPTHVHGMTRARTREGARETAAKPDSGVTLEPGIDGPGLREWLQSLPKPLDKRAAAFDTRIDAPAILTGRASTSIASELRRRGLTLVTEPESFLVDKRNQLVADELERATRWASGLVTPSTARI